MSTKVQHWNSFRKSSHQIMIYDVMRCNLWYTVYIYWRFGGTYCLQAGGFQLPVF